MRKIKCLDVLTSVTDEATKRFSPMFTEDRGRKLYMEEICEILDVFLDDYNGSSFEVEVDETTMEIIVTVVCDEFETMGKNTFGKLSRMANEITVCKYEDEVIKVKFKFDGIWVHK